MRLLKNLKDLMEKTQNPKFFEISPELVPPFSLESSMKRILRRFESNQNKSKQMKINDVFDCFTSKVGFSYDNSVSLQTDDAGHVGAAVLGRIFCLY